MIFDGTAKAIQISTSDETVVGTYYFTIFSVDSTNTTKFV